MRKEDRSRLARDAEARNLDGIASPALGDKTFGAVGDDTLAKLVAAGQKVLLDAAVGRSGGDDAERHHRNRNHARHL